MLRIENLGTNEANVYLNKELDREVSCHLRKTPEICCLSGGEVTRVKRVLVRQVRDEYLLVLTLTDGRLGDGNFITQSLLLLVEDVNDNEPVFKPYPPSITVLEDAEPGVLATVEATDLDEGAYGQVCQRFRFHPLVSLFEILTWLETVCVGLVVLVAVSEMLLHWSFHRAPCSFFCCIQSLYEKFKGD